MEATEMTRLTIICISFIVVSLMFVGMSVAIDQASVMGMWLFDEGSGDVAADSSGNGNAGTLTNGPVWEDGKLDGGMFFDGSDDIVLVDMTVDYDEITVMALFNLGAGNVRPRFVGNSHTDVTKKGFQLMYNTAGSGSWFDIGTGGGRAAASFAFTAAQDTWYHYAGTYDGSDVKAYIDGVEMASGALSGAIADSGEDVHIGMRPGGDRLKGILDEVAIFNKALTQDEIKDIMAKGLSEALGMAAVSPSGKLAATWGQIKK